MISITTFVLAVTAFDQGEWRYSKLSVNIFNTYHHMWVRCQLTRGKISL